MAISGLNLPIDIPWQRVCVTTDMLDPARGQVAETPALWQSSLALFRYVPPDEYQIYPGRRIIYYKLTCTITNYHPKSEQIIGLIDPGVFTTRYMLNDEVQRRLEMSLACTAAVVHVSVSPVDSPAPSRPIPTSLKSSHGNARSTNKSPKPRSAPVAAWKRWRFARGPAAAIP